MLVGLGLLAGLVAAIVNAGVALEWITPELDLMGKRLMTEGMVLLLVLGVGGFLGPRLLGFAQLPNLQSIGTVREPTRVPTVIRSRQWVYALAGICILISVILEYADPNGPWGARGMAEMPFIPLAPAITAAVHDATGIWMDLIPLTPDRVVDLESITPAFVKHITERERLQRELEIARDVQMSFLEELRW